MAQAVLLAHPREGADLVLTTDASDTAMGAVLEQVKNDTFEPLGFFSHQFSLAQRNYRAYDRELTVAYQAIKHFRPLIEGRNVVLRTDHKPLTFAFQQKADKASPRQWRQLDLIAQYTITIIHIKDSKNDVLSRLNAINLPTIVSIADIAEEQKEDAELQHILQSDSALQLKRLRVDSE